MPVDRTGRCVIGRPPRRQTGERAPSTRAEPTAMAIAPWLWVVFTLVAATAQTFRNAAQRSLTGSLGTVGATHVRFLFGLPFGRRGADRRRIQHGQPADAESHVARLDGDRRAGPDRRHRPDARRDARALVRRHDRLYENRAGPGRAVRGRLSRRASEPRADRSDRDRHRRRSPALMAVARRRRGVLASPGGSRPRLGWPVRPFRGRLSRGDRGPRVAGFHQRRDAHPGHRR